MGGMLYEMIFELDDLGGRLSFSPSQPNFTYPNVMFVRNLLSSSEEEIHNLGPWRSSIIEK